jgi:ribosomal protein L19E
MAVSNSVFGSNTLKFDDVVGVILSEEMQWKSTSETSRNALNMENRGRQKDRGKGSGNCGNSRKGRSKSRLRKIECWNCGKKGHMKKYCRAPKKQRDGQ